MRQLLATPALARSRRGLDRGSRTLARSGVLLASWLLGLGTAAQAQMGADTLDVRRLSFEGNEAFRASALQSAILTEATHCRSAVLAPFCWFGGDWAIERRTLSRPELGRDIPRLRLFYFRRGYRETAVDTVVVEDGSGGVAVTFQIDEGRPVRVVRVLADSGGVSVLAPDGGDLPLQPGQPLSLLRLEASREALLTRFRNQGFAHVEVLAGFSIPASAPDSAEVRFEVIPGPSAHFGAISVQGVRDLDEGTVRRVMGIEEGELYREDRLGSAQRNVFQLDIVRHAEILSDLTPPVDSVVPLEVRVNEAAPHRIRGGAGLNTFECVNVEARWTSRNFRGGGRRLEVSTRLWNAGADELAGSLCNQAGTGVYGRLNYQVSVDFFQPVLFSPRNSLSTRLFVERESFPNLFVRQTVGTDLLFSRNIGRLSATGIFYRPQYGSYDAADAYFCSSFLICEPEEIAIVSSANLLSPIGITLSTDRTNPVTDPVRGWTGMIAFEKAGTLTLSDYTYDRLILEGSTFKELGRGTQRVLGTRLRVGLLQPRGFGGVTTEATDIDVTAPQKRFFSGGATTVRGFAQGRLGPRNLQTDVRNLVASPESPESAGPKRLST
jgi:outer membrane protein assembly factor BamA